MALLFGTMLCSLSTVILTHLGFVTGQTAGIAVVISYATGIGFGPIFFVVNLPFYVLALRRMGMRFTVKTFTAVALVTGFMAVMPGWITFQNVDPIFGAVLVGALAGAGLLILFRHGASLGGVGVLALLIQERTGFRAGWTQLLIDAVIFGAAFFVIAPGAWVYSVLGAVVLNVIIAMNHRKDRYIAT